MTSIADVIKVLEQSAPPSLQESYDNSGLIAGNVSIEVKNVLVCLDSTEAVIEEAIEKNCNLVISHHPILFRPISSITGKNYVERTLLLAIKNDIAIYAMHTNLDSIKGGVNGKIAKLLDLRNVQILSQKMDVLRKLVVFCPRDHVESVRNSIFNAGAGRIGAYDRCSFNVEGDGTFRGDETTNPHSGKPGKDHTESEVRIETIFRKFNQNKILRALVQSHPYEEVAYDIYPIDNPDPEHGIGITGFLDKPENSGSFIQRLKGIFKVPVVRHTNPVHKNVHKVAICGGSGSFMIDDAIRSESDIYITSDIKYHEFFDADGKIIIADIGHYESEQFTPAVIGDILKENFSTFATHFSRVNTNPIIYS